MFVLQRAGEWFAGLLESFDDALVALDDDVDALRSAAEPESCAPQRLSVSG